MSDREPPLYDPILPSPTSNGRDQMLVDLRKQLDVVSKVAGFNGRRIRTKVFRHTYCSARFQILDNGAPVAPYTVSRELGHSSTAMVERVYSHLGRIRHRSEVVEYPDEGSELAWRVDGPEVDLSPLRIRLGRPLCLRDAVT